MFDYETPRDKSRTDWSGTIIGAALLPVFFLFAAFDKEELGFNLIIVLGMAIYAVKLRWKLRRYVWFWVIIGLILALHIPFLFVVHWPESNVPTIVYSLPLGIWDFLLIMGGIGLAQKIFLRGAAPEEGDE